MMDMLTDCAIFRTVDERSTNYYQMSGPPLFDLEATPASKAGVAQAHLPGRKSAGVSVEERTPFEIAFVRSRMFYAKAALNAKGGIRFGMRHIRQ